MTWPVECSRMFSGFRSLQVGAWGGAGGSAVEACVSLEGRQSRRRLGWEALRPCIAQHALGSQPPQTASTLQAPAPMQCSSCAPVHVALHVKVLQRQQHLAGVEPDHILLQPLAAGRGWEVRTAWRVQQGAHRLSKVKGGGETSSSPCTCMRWMCPSAKRPLTWAAS